jgi:hypothetical protein
MFGTTRMDAGPARRTLVRSLPAALLVALVVATTASARPAASSSRAAAALPSYAECLALLSSAPRPGTQLEPPQRGRLLDVVATFVEQLVPQGQRYVFPTAAERARFQCGFQFAAARRLAEAQRLLEPLQYDVKQLIDTGTEAARPLVMLEERKVKRRDGVERYPHAWGLYVTARGTAPPLVAVEVPHQCRSTERCDAVGGDRRTHTMAVTAFERAAAKYLFVAGTDRGATAVGCAQPPCSADVAHEAESMFEAVHEAALTPRLSIAKANRVYQPHGFSTTGHPASCLEVVVSAGLEQTDQSGIETTPLASRIAADLNDDPSDVYGKKVLLYGQDIAPPGNPDGHVDCSPEDDRKGGLGATTNVQGRFAAQLMPPRDFISVEASQHVRNLAAERDALAGTVGRVVSVP